MNTSVLLLASLIWISCVPLVLFGQEPAFAARQAHRLFEEYEQWERREFPESAMSRGDYSNADRITDNSLAAIERRHRETVAFLERLERIDRTQLDEIDLVNCEIFELMLRRAVERFRFRTFLAPMGSRFGPQQEVPQMGEHVRFESRKDYLDYFSRLEQVPRSIRNTIELMRIGVAEERVPPRVVMQGVPAQFASLLEGGALDRLAAPLDEMPEQIDGAERTQLREQFQRQVLPPVREAMAELGRFVSESYIPACRETIAATDWPDGEAYYAFQLETMTTTDMTASQIHELGLREVARIRSEMMEVIRASDYPERHPEAASQSDEELFRSFIAYLRTDPRFYYNEPEALLDGYRAICKEVDGHMPKFFGVLPRLPYGVREVPLFMAPGQTTAYYMPGDLRNAEAGYFYANTYALDQRPKYEMISLALHEAVPGHHHQIAIAKEIDGLPEFRKNNWFTAFGEGWALYAERLGIEMDLFQDPYDDFGRLLYEMWRACRLVVDPGMHALGWSRSQAVDFMLENTALSELNINNEVDRYIAWPGQATAYKIGELKIRALREEAEQRLGANFNRREFHDVVLGAGSVPLSVLERRVENWIKAKQLAGVSYD